MCFLPEAAEVPSTVTQLADDAFEGGRLLPSFVQDTPGLSPPSGSVIRSKGGKKAGKVFSSVNNIGVAQVRLKHALGDDVELECEGFRVLPYVPTWWPQWPLTAA